MPGNARLAGKQEKALGPAPSPYVLYPVTLSGEHAWSLVLSTTGSEHIALSQVCSGQREVQWSLPVSRRVQPFVLALQVLRLGSATAM